MNAVEDWFGETALHTAARHGHADVCKLLLERGANADARKFDEISYDEVLTRGLERGEVPGLLWLDVARENGRIGEPNLRDTNPRS